MASLNVGDATGHYLAWKSYTGMFNSQTGRY